MSFVTGTLQGTVIMGPHLSDWRRFLEFELQEQDPGLEGNSKYAHYTDYIHLHMIRLIQLLELDRSF